MQEVSEYTSDRDAALDRGQIFKNMVLLCSQYKIWRFKPTPLHQSELVEFANAVALHKEVGKLCMSPELSQLVENLALGNLEDATLPNNVELIQSADALYSVAEIACYMLLFSDDPVGKNNAVQKFAWIPELLGIPKWRRRELYVEARRTIVDNDGFLNTPI
jgi:hypothetical protein